MGLTMFANKFACSESEGNCGIGVLSFNFQKAEGIGRVSATPNA